MKNKPIFKVYHQDFICDCCGQETFMGIIGFSERYPKICDLCLVNEVNNYKSEAPPRESNVTRQIKPKK